MFEKNISSSSPTNPTSDWQSVEFLPASAISYFIPVGTRAVVKCDADFFKISHSTIEHEDIFEDGSHQLTITLSLAMRANSQASLLDNMSQSGQYIVRLTDKFGAKFLFGTPLQPLRLRHSDTLAHNATIIFHGSTSTPPLIQID